MADPKLDEDYIIALLRGAVVHENVARLQAGAMQALLDLYDRQATREEFINNASACCALFGQVAKFYMLKNIEVVHTEGSLDQQKFMEAEAGLQDLIRKQCESVIEIVKRLQLCPTSQDLVH